MLTTSAPAVHLPDHVPSAIFLDLDGTALRPDGTFSPATKAAVADAIDRGVPVAIATGRSTPQALGLARDLGLIDDTKHAGTTAYVICETGAVTAEAQSGTIIDEHRIDPKTAGDVISYGETHGYDMTVVTDRKQLAHDGSPSASSPFVDAHVPDFAPYAASATTIWASGNGAAHDMAQHFGGRGVNVTIDTALGHEQAEISTPNTSKGIAVRALLARIGADPSRAIAIGDGQIDESMITVVGQGVAMGNAVDELKAMAPYRTASNTNDGVALAIESALHGTLA